MVGRRQAKNVGNDIYGVRGDWKVKQRLGDSAESGFRHSDYYHKYFHGYTEVRTEKPNGGYRFKRFYTDDWYVRGLAGSRYWLCKLLYVALFALSAGLYLWLMSRPGFSGNRSVYVAVPGFASAVCLLLLAASVLEYLFTGRRMTWWDYQSSSGRVKRFAIAAAVGLSCTAAAILVCAVLGAVSVLPGLGTEASAGEMWAAASMPRELALGLGVEASALAAFAIYWLEKRMPYLTEKNDTVLPEGEAHRIY